MKGLHDEIGHWDFNKTYRIMSERFLWPAMRMEVYYFVESGDICQKTNPPVQGLAYGKMPVCGLFHTLSLDFAVPLLPQLVSRHLLIGVEHLTGWPVAQTLLEHLFNSMGVL